MPGSLQNNTLLLILLHSTTREDSRYRKCQVTCFPQWQGKSWHCLRCCNNLSELSVCTSPHLPFKKKMGKGYSETRDDSGSQGWINSLSCVAVLTEVLDYI